MLLKAWSTYLQHHNTGELVGNADTRAPPDLLNQTLDFNKVPLLVTVPYSCLQTGIVSVGGWSGDILKSQKKGICKTICQEAFINSVIWASISMHNQPFYLVLQPYLGQQNPAPHPHPKVPSQNRLPSISNSLSPPRQEGGKRQGETRRMPRPQFYPKNHSRAHTELKPYRGKRVKPPKEPAIDRGSV